ncbi:MAG TPA: tripartite tricarboxylate transporter substrate binding protein [Burkholderiales bacterium]|nr:tripartite tricarboxylate transporter substrate binding protein [Burkholderiales bacterium]
MRLSRLALATAHAITALTLLGACAVATAAESYPSRPIRLVNPFPPGGSVDFYCRVVAQRVSEALGQRIVIDHRPGAGTTIGTEIAVRAQPDGHTLLCSSGAIAITRALYPKLPFDPLKDLTMVALVSQSPIMLAVHPSVNVRSVRDLLDLARAKPGELRFVSSGIGSTVHLALEQFKYLAKVDLTHVPYKGGAQSMLDLIAGQVHGAFQTPPTIGQHIKSGKLRAIAMGTAKRSEFAPELPTIAETGVPGYEAAVWYAVFAPRAVNPRIVERWNTEINRALQMDEVKKVLFANGMSPIGGTVREGNDFFAREVPRWAQVIKAANITAEQ